MTWRFTIASIALVLAGAGALAADRTSPPASAHGPRYTDDGRLSFPSDYREWIYLSSGLDMSYRKRTGASGHSMFDNIFVNPEAYRIFLATGTWPEHTELVMEVRGAASKGSINQAGSFQTGELMGVEVHLKDTRRFDSGWAFFAFDGTSPAACIPAAAECYACHRQHAAVDTTFVQFYPTLFDIAKDKGRLSESYRKDAANNAAPAQ